HALQVLGAERVLLGVRKPVLRHQTFEILPEPRHQLQIATGVENHLVGGQGADDIRNRHGGASPYIVAAWASCFLNSSSTLAPSGVSFSHSATTGSAALDQRDSSASVRSKISVPLCASTSLRPSSLMRSQNAPSSLVNLMPELASTAALPLSASLA